MLQATNPAYQAALLLLKQMALFCVFSPAAELCTFLPLACFALQPATEVMPLSHHDPDLQANTHALAFEVAGAVWQGSYPVVPAGLRPTPL